MTRPFLIALSLILGAHASAASLCEELTGLHLPRITVASAHEVPADGSAKLQLPAYCQVLGDVTTAGLKREPDNHVHFEVDLPLQNWNRKLYFAGGGGFSGGHSVKAPLQSGYASAYTDTGHKELAGFDASWANVSFTKKVDFFYRGIHVATDASKQIVKAYYSDALQHSYFVGCSTGGKQALMEAQRYPDDYDGVVAGAPALDYTGLMLQFSWNQRALLRSADSYLTPAALELVAKAVSEKCDALDGVSDGLISDPLHCDFDPTTLRCKEGATGNCLSDGQIDSLRKIYSGPKTSTGKAIFPGIPVGHEDSRDHLNWLVGTHPPVPQADGSLRFAGNYVQDRSAVPMEFAYQENFLRYLAFSEGAPDYDWRSFDFDRDVRRTEPLAKLHNATDADLSRFERRGGKLLLYSGWADPVVSPLRTVQYFEEVNRRMGNRRVEQFARLFMAPGMDHCGNGPGPNEFDSLGALDRWVTKGEPPTSLVATHRNSNSPDRKRPLCPYPQTAKWNGTGSIDEAESFACTTPLTGKP